MAEENSELLKSLMGMLGENPEEKIAAALSSLGVERDAVPEKTEKTHKKNSPPEPENSLGGELDALLKIGSLLSDAGGEDERARLLKALKPFLSEEKRPKVDSAVKMLRLAKLAEAAGKTDLLKNLKL